MLTKKTVLELFEAWYDGLKLYAGGFPARGTIGGALVVLEQMKESFDLNIDAYTAGGGSQIKGASGAAVGRILESFDETRPFLSEGGRTNRGLRGDIKNMLVMIGKTKLHSLSDDERRTVLTNLQQFLVNKVRDYHNQQRLDLFFDPAKSTRRLIHDLLDKARTTGKAGPVAQYLVGAKLQIRFPNIVVENHSYSTADAPLARAGDFKVGDTAFHVTVSLMINIYPKCKRNIVEGLKVYLLVPETLVSGAREMAEEAAPEKITVESIESFIAQNIDELSGFSQEQFTVELLKLLETYNRRVDEVENDKSMLIEIPPNLKR